VLFLLRQLLFLFVVPSIAMQVVCQLKINVY
jgi:hypothetical protein